MLARRLPVLTSLVLAAGAVNAHRLPPRTVWGDVYGHVANHLVSAGASLAVAVTLLALARRCTTARGRRAVRAAGGAWGLVSTAFVLDAVGGGIGDRTGDYRLHDLAMVLLLVAAVLLLAATVLLLVTGGSPAPWRLRLAVLASAPGTLALNEASSTGWLLTGLLAAGAWLLVAVPGRQRTAAPASTAALVPA